MVSHWIWLAARKGLSWQDRQILLEQYTDAAQIYMDQEYLGLSDAARESLQDKDLTEARKILSDCDERGIQVLTWQDAAYPRQLRNIDDPPLVLYYIGRLPDLESLPAIGVVGTRKASAYGLSCAVRMGAQIAMGGGAVISGMALGIDGAAMEGALGRNGRVIGVLGGGVDIVYPAGNRKLYEQLVRQGCLISEYPPGCMPQKWTFPRRNRIISGLSCGVLVVEAPRSSGALITAQQALEQGRDVFAVPGNVNSVSSAGSNDLLKQGAAVVTTGWDILENYQYRFPDQICKVPGCDDPAMRLPDTGVSRQPADQNLGKVAQNPVVPENCRKENQKNDRNVIDNSQLPPYSDVNKPILKLTPQAEKILQTLSKGDMPVDELIYRSGIPAAQVISTLTLLEIKGLIRRLPGKIIHRVEP